MSRLVIEFPDEKTRYRFAGGEDDFFISEEHHTKERVIVDFDYSKCFEGWGYDPEKHGPDLTIEAMVD